MNRVAFSGLVFILFIAGHLKGFGLVSDTTALKPKPLYGKEANLTVEILNNNHYSKIRLDDSLSSSILDEYLVTLDNNRTYFMSGDIAGFEKYRFKLDDLTKDQDVSPAYDIYAVFKQRFNERMDYVFNNLINKDFDYSLDEYYETDRAKEPWAKSTDELNDIWRKVIKSQALSLKLAGKKPEEIKETIKTRYERLAKSINQVNSEDVFSMYLNTITSAYDPHTNYFSPKAADAFKTSMSLSLEGIGARLQTENDYTKVVEILPGGPAEKSDLIHANDRIIGVAQGADGEMVDVIGWRVDEVVKLIKGPKGTKVRLLFLPAATGVAGPPTEITLVRDKIKLEDQRASKSVIHYQNDGRDLKLGVITLPSFYMDFEAYQKRDPNYMSTTRDVKRLVDELESEGINGLVIDLRNNGGGSLEEAINLTGLFIKDGPVVQVKSSGNKIDVRSDDDPSIEYDGPLVVLTNRFSASASEIFAGAIQDYNRGVVVGESTHGKGTVQTIIDLNRFIGDTKEPVGELKLTFQKFYRVTGSSTQKKGVTPDIQLPTPYDSKEFGEGSYPNALPWDEIRGTLFQRTPIINNKVITDLNKSYAVRFKTDPSLNQFTVETEDFKKSLAETKISLNEAVRKKEMDEAEKKRAASKSLNTSIKTPETKVVQNLSELDDEYLREGLLVLSDLINTKIG
ncbi:MAG TPA: carboxy terminal-processing peptidase [Cyclobacteriaceae bacterium]|nr:carboxy terminal-processing peptidase [Cyclobacteriaceae bacterium]